MSRPSDSRRSDKMLRNFVFEIPANNNDDDDAQQKNVRRWSNVIDLQLVAPPFLGIFHFGVCRIAFTLMTHTTLTKNVNQLHMCTETMSRINWNLIHVNKSMDQIEIVKKCVKRSVGRSIINDFRQYFKQYVNTIRICVFWILHLFLTGKVLSPKKNHIESNTVVVCFTAGVLYSARIDGYRF